ncbi:prolipoprotein diacylglyceryl transferase [Dermatophilaceae bacterium Sec6.4]|nr:prolipoprotein diacylglyceryl transferase [Actinomycetota bacterium]
MNSYLPSPTHGVWWIGPLPIRGYALCILAGIFAAVWVAGRRIIPRGGKVDDIYTVAWWAVPFGIVGGRLYNVITSPGPYFGKGGHPLDAFAIWQGGLGIWGAVALGAVGGLIGARKAGISFLDFADAAVPGILLAQAMGRWGNYFNNELYGGLTNLPWKLQIYEWDSARGHAVYNGGKAVVLGYYQPTFLYESIWVLLVAIAILVIDRRVLLGRGRATALYIMGYPMGRIVFELMRTDPANYILGERVNVWVSILVFLGGAVLFVMMGRRHPDGIREGLASPAGTAGTVSTADGVGDAPEQGGDAPSTVSKGETGKSTL